MKISTKLGLGIASAVAVASALKYKKLADMDFVERCKMCSEKFVNTIEKLHIDLPDPPVDNFDKIESDNLTGRKYFSEAPRKAKWSLGYSQKSILPDDIDTKKYCIAGNTRLPANYAAGVLDDIRVRTVAVDDNSGRGKIVFCSVDCIGISNKNIKEPTSQLNILPTVLNLFNANYKPNNYIGEDALNPKYDGIVFFSDYSWYDGNVFVENATVTNNKNIKFFNNLTEREVIENNPLNLAFIGDAVWTMFVREYFLMHTNFKNNNLQMKFNYIINLIHK